MKENSAIMPLLTVAHDYICPWCWVARRQAEKLRDEFPTLVLVWKGYELLPEGLESASTPVDKNAPVKPATPSRFDLMLLAEGLKLPVRKRKYSISRKALEGAEFALEAGKAEAWHDAVYFAYWEESKNIAEWATLKECAEKAGLDSGELKRALDEGKYRERVIEYDDPAHEAGVWNVPTWMFEGNWIAETPYVVLRGRIKQFVEENA